MRQRSASYCRLAGWNDSGGRVSLRHTRGVGTLPFTSGFAAPAGRSYTRLTSHETESEQGVAPQSATRSESDFSGSLQPSTRVGAAPPVADVWTSTFDQDMKWRILFGLSISLGAFFALGSYVIPSNPSAAKFPDVEFQGGILSLPSLSTAIILFASAGLLYKAKIKKSNRVALTDG